MHKFVIITDTHFAPKSNVRTGDLLEDIVSKLTFVRDYCNSNNAQLVIPGDVFDKSTVPDFVKSALAPLFLSFDKTPLAIPGNHDRLFNSDELSHKTSLHVWFTHNLIKELTYIETEDYILHSVKPLVNRGKPQLAIFHGFLNQDDGRNSVYFNDLITTDNTAVVLGHDHTVYAPLTLGTVQIFRPGSFLRKTRTDDSLRIPEMLVLSLTDGCWNSEMVPIETARSF